MGCGNSKTSKQEPIVAKQSDNKESGAPNV